MKDYSNFFKSAYGFMTKYDVVDNKVCVYSAKSKKGEPQEYPASKEMVDFFDKRLEEQYKLILKNRDIVKSEYLDKTGKIVNISSWVLYFISIILGVVISIFSGVIFPILLGLVGGSLIKALSGLVLEKMEKRFDLEMNTIEEYLEKREILEKSKDCDPNITNYLKKKTVDLIEKNEELKRNGIIDSTFNIDLMDKAELKELRKMLERNRITTELGTKESFVTPDKYKKRVKKK